MARKTPIEKLTQSIEKILDEYGDDVQGNMDEIIQKVGKSGVTALRNESKAKFNGTKYAKGWKATTEKTRLSTRVIIHNTLPGLPHLLEKGHAKRGGGRVSGREHIAPVEDQIVREIEAAANEIAGD